MAVRTPLYYYSGNLRDMTSAMIDEIIDQTIYQHSLNPPNTITVVASGGAALPTLSDTRLQAGAYSSSATGYPSEATTAEPSVVTVSYDKMNETNAVISAPTGHSFPVYRTASNQIQEMSETDFYDTFIYPAVDLLSSGSITYQQAGTYHIQSTTSYTGSTLVSATPVFVDTRADTSLYTAGSIPETLDQPTTITNYYLHKIDGTDNSYTAPMYKTAGNDLQTYTTGNFESALSDYVRYAVSQVTGYRLRYSVYPVNADAGNNRGTGMTDTRLNGSGNYQTLFVNADDYRAQEFPNGTAVTINTYYLRIGLI